MVALINYIPVFILIIAALYVYRVQVSASKNKARNTVFCLIISLVAIYFYQAFQPSYMVKGVVNRTSIPQFEYKELTVKDRLSKPVPGEERDRKRNEEYNKKLPFINEADWE